MNSSIWEIPTITHAVIFEIYHKKMNNSTLNKDINLIERENGYWDYEFQYGDLVLSENNQSLRNSTVKETQPTPYSETVPMRNLKRKKVQWSSTRYDNIS